VLKGSKRPEGSETMLGITRWPAIYVRVDPEVYATVNAIANVRGTPASVVVREALNRAFKERTPSPEPRSLKIAQRAAHGPAMGISERR
jgi:hypothetical protein